MEFNDFEQITCPYPAPAYKNPSWVVDFLLFSSDAAIEYAKIQYDILKRITPDKFVTHNGIFGNIDNKKFTDASTYYEVLNVKEAEPIAVFSGGTHKGKPCFVKNKNVYYLGTYFNESTACVYEDIIKNHIDIPFNNLNDCIEAFNYTEYSILLNYSDKKMSLPYTVYDMFSEKDTKEIEGYGVILVNNIVK